MHKDNESALKGLQAEEERMRTQREKEDAKREAEMEKEREEDLNSGKEVLDKKFQQLEFLMNKSKVGTYLKIQWTDNEALANISLTALRDCYARADAAARGCR
jgi:hypothetical protein